MKNYESLDDALSDLKKKGYEDDFATESFCLYCSDLDMRLDPQDFHVDEIDRVAGNSNPGDGATVYAIFLICRRKRHRGGGCGWHAFREQRILKGLEKKHYSYVHPTEHGRVSQK